MVTSELTCFIKVRNTISSSVVNMLQEQKYILRMIRSILVP